MNIFVFIFLNSANFAEPENTNLKLKNKTQLHLFFYHIMHEYFFSRKIRSVTKRLRVSSNTNTL